MSNKKESEYTSEKVWYEKVTSWLTFLVLLLIVLIMMYWLPLRDGVLIQGVPYSGVYTDEAKFNPVVTAVYSLLQYWGDDRLSPQEIADYFDYFEEAHVDFEDVYVFFEQRGYTTRFVEISNLDELKSLLRSKKQPIIVLQRLSVNSPQEPAVFRVLIEYSTKDNAFIVHDHIYGNNYKINANVFDALMINTPRAVLTVEPTKEISSKLDGVDLDYKYPQRLNIMDSPEMQNIQTKIFTLGYLENVYAETHNETLRETIMRMREEIIIQSGFEELHPLSRVLISRDLARDYTNVLGEHAKALEILENITLPLLEQDLSAPFGEWVPPEADIYAKSWWYTKPWVLKGIIHQRLGSPEAAITAFKKALEIEPLDVEALAYLTELSPVGLDAVRGKFSPNQAFVEQLVQGSPWKGEGSNDLSDTVVTFDLIFNNDGGFPHAFIEKAEGSLNDFSGSVDHLFFGDNTVYFQSAGGAWYSIYLAEGGLLLGKAYLSSYPTILNDITLTSSK